MTRKDYILIAEAIKLAHDGSHSEQRDVSAIERAAIYDTASLIARALRRDNDRFERAAFMEACGFPAGE